MKYEMIFGDESLFDGAPEDAEYAGWFCQETRWYMILNGKILFSDGGSWCTSDNPYLSADIAAMRRIIKEPAISGDIDDLIKDEFSEWWEKEGCLVRSGGGDRERTFAFAAFRKLMPEILAARRLKKTPVWTVADQRAGRLPEVGCKIAGKRTGINTVLFNNGDYIVTVSDGHCAGKYIADEVFAYFKPIETPSEKAQRLEDEWVESAFDAVMIVGVHSTEDIQRIKNHLRTIYRAQLSGELAAPKGGE